MDTFALTRERDERPFPLRRLPAAAAALLLHIIVLSLFFWHLKPSLRTPLPAPSILVEIIEPERPTLPVVSETLVIRPIELRAQPPEYTAPGPPEADLAVMEPVHSQATIVREPARIPATPAAAEPKPPRPSPDDYVAKLAAQLARVKRYPSGARVQREQGTVLLYFELNRSGRLLSWHIAQGSGFADLDREVARMIGAAAPFPPFPPTLDKNSDVFLVPVEFSLKAGAR